MLDYDKPLYRLVECWGFNHVTINILLTRCVFSFFDVYVRAFVVDIKKSYAWPQKHFKHADLVISNL